MAGVTDAVVLAAALNGSMTATDVPLTMYTTTWCGFCLRLKAGLKTAGIGFHEIDIERDPAAAEFVASVNRGNRTVPTVRFADGSTLTNPGVGEVKRTLAALANRPGR